MESLNLTVVTSGLVVLFITLTHQPPAETPGHSEGGASRKLVVRARVLPAQQGHGDERQPGSSRRRARGDGAHGLGEQGEREIRPLPPQNAGCGCVRGAAGAGARSDLAISNCARPDHEQDAGGAEICCRPDRRPGMTQDLAGAAPARGRSPAVDRVGSKKMS